MKSRYSITLDANCGWGFIIQQINKEKIRKTGRIIDIIIINSSPQSICSGNVSEK